MSIRLFVAALLVMPAAVFAQSNPGPFGGLFGRTPERIGRDYTALDFRSSGAVQLNDALLMPEGLPLEGVPQRGTSSGVSASLMFDRASDRLRLNARAGGSYQESYRDPILGATGIETSATVAATVTTRLTVDAAAGYRYSPFFQTEPLLAASTLDPAVPVPGSSYAMRALDHESFDVRAGFTSHYSKRSTLSASVSRRETWFDDPRDNYESTGGAVRWGRRMSRDVTVRLGYSRDQVRTHALPDADNDFVHETLDVGVDFSRELPIGPRTSIDFETNTGMVKESGGPRHFRLDGSVGVTKYFHRTWHASARFARDTDFLPGFVEPLFSDSLSASIGGMVSKRSEWHAVVGAGRGRFGFSQPRQDFLNADATTRLVLGLTRHLGAFGQYTYYFYDMATGAAVVPVVSKMSRQTIVVGLTAWAPIINRVRTESDTR